VPETAAAARPVAGWRPSQSGAPHAIGRCLRAHQPGKVGQYRDNKTRREVKVECHSTVLAQNLTC
jgi:hypothetical protein